MTKVTRGYDAGTSSWCRKQVAGRRPSMDTDRVRQAVRPGAISTAGPSLCVLLQIDAAYERTRTVTSLSMPLRSCENHKFAMDTTEKLGFSGRAEGIAANAAALLILA